MLSQHTGCLTSCPLCLGTVSIKTPAQIPVQFSSSFPQASLCSDACGDLAAGTILLWVFTSLCPAVASSRSFGCGLSEEGELSVPCSQWHMKPQNLITARQYRAGSLGSLICLRGLIHSSSVASRSEQQVNEHTAAAPKQPQPAPEGCREESRGLAACCLLLCLGGG